MRSRPAGPTSWSACRPEAWTPLPAIEFLSEKSIIGSYYGTGDVQRRSRAVELVVSGRLELAHMVSDLIGLDGVADAMERLRRGEGDRSVIVIDASLAGAAR